MYANNKTIQDYVDFYTSKEFRKRIILETKTNCYTYDAKRFSNRSSAAGHLLALGINNPIFAASSSYSLPVVKVAIDKDNRFIDLIRFYLNTSVRALKQGLDSITLKEGQNIFRMFKNKKTLSFHKYSNPNVRNDCYGLGRYTNWRLTNITPIDECEDFDQITFEGTNYSNYFTVDCNDIDSADWLDIVVANKRSHFLTEENAKLIKDFLLPSSDAFGIWCDRNEKDKFENTWDIKTALKIPIELPSSKQNQTKEMLLRDVFNPIIKRIPYTKENKTKNEYIVRYDGWLVFSDRTQSWSEKHLFYNIKSGKKYLVFEHTYKNSIGVCDIKNHFSDFMRSANWLKGRSLGIKCIDIEGNSISPRECFAGTIGEEMFNYCANSRVYNSDRSNYATIAELEAENKTLGIILFPICCNKAVKIVSELMLKCGFVNLLTQSVREFDVFKSKIQDATSLNKILGFTQTQLKMLDEYIGETKNPCYALSEAFNIQSLFDENIFKSMDNQTFEKYLSYNTDHHTYSFFSRNRVNSLAKELDVKSPKELLSICEKYSATINLYADYLRMRRQLEAAVSTPGIDIAYDKSQFPKRPGKSTVVVILRPTRNYWYLTDAASQLRTYQYGYPGCVEILNKQGEDLHTQTITIKLTLTPEYNLKYLHDQISYLIRLAGDKGKQGLFVEGVKRVLPLEYKGKELSVVAPKSIEDLQQEGMILHHCVASFVDPIINNTENVVFIRRNDMSDHPFFTVAIDNNGKIEQIHCANNGSLSEDAQLEAYTHTKYDVYNKVFDIVAFLKEWAKATGKVDLSTIKTKYGALCARR